MSVFRHSPCVMRSLFPCSVFATRIQHLVAILLLSGGVFGAHIALELRGASTTQSGLSLPFEIGVAITCVAFVATLHLLVTLLPSQPGPNKYGPNPNEALT